jgi:hypothetical protein
MLWTLSVAAGLFFTLAAAVIAFTCWGARWGATTDECAEHMPGDDYFSGGPPAFVSMTRAVSINAPRRRLSHRLSPPNCARQ